MLELQRICNFPPDAHKVFVGCFIKKLVISNYRASVALKFSLRLNYLEGLLQLRLLDSTPRNLVDLVKGCENLNYKFSSDAEAACLRTNY